MDQILDLIQSFDFKNFDFLAVLNSLMGILKIVLRDYVGKGKF